MVLTAATRLAIPLVGTDAVGQVIVTVTRADAVLGDALHADNQTRPYACWRDTVRGRLVVTTFSDRMAEAVCRGADRVEVLGRTTADEVIGSGSRGRRMTVEFLAPTHLRTAHRDYLFPAPERVFANLGERWTAMGWPLLNEINLNRIAGKPLRYQVGEHPCARGVRQMGWIGAVEYDLTGLGIEQQEAAWALMRFAEWRGIGAHTGYGMGVTRIAGG